VFLMTILSSGLNFPYRNWSFVEDSIVEDELLALRFASLGCGVRLQLSQPGNAVFRLVDGRQYFRHVIVVSLKLQMNNALLFHLSLLTVILWEFSAATPVTPRHHHAFDSISYLILLKLGCLLCHSVYRIFRHRTRKM
jgi:hypothetical protein